MRQLWVVGSLNMDMVCFTPRFVRPGETLTVRQYHEFPGGKGANQAVALARLGARPRLVGLLGDDPLGQKYRRILEKEGVDPSTVTLVAGRSTGLAIVEVTARGRNRILVVPNANGDFSPAQLSPLRDQIQPGDLVLVQLEIPLPTVIATLTLAKEKGAVTILDPAPAVDLPSAVLALVDYLTPNETEALRLVKPEAPTVSEPVAAARWISKTARCRVILKMGEKGCAVVTGDEVTSVSAYRVSAVDTTGAGDSFNAGFAFALACGSDAGDAARFGNAVAALSTMSSGAQSSMPTLQQVTDFLAARDSLLDHPAR